MLHYLNSNEYEDTPAWLMNYRPGDRPRLTDLGRAVYYPGAGEDHQPAELFAGAHSAHFFIYLDYFLYTQSFLKRKVRNSTITGYSVLGCTSYHLEDELNTPQITTHLTRTELDRALNNQFDNHHRTARLVVFEKNNHLDHGRAARRFAVLYLSADGILTYDKLFASHLMPPPLAVVLQDHAWGCNYDSFGRGGLLNAIATRSGVIPSYLLVACNTTCWEGYRRLPRLRGMCGGMHGFLRELYAPDSTQQKAHR